jgi:hypothetical protein
MGGVLDAQVHIGRETTYGTPVTPTRSIEALEDIASAQREPLESVGMRAGLQTQRVDRRRVIFKGAEGELNVNPHEVGFGMLLRAAIGESSITQVGTTDAYLQTHSTGPAAPDEYLTAVIGRPPVDPSASVIPWTYAGGIIHEVEFEQEVDEYLSVTFGLDFQREITENEDDAEPLPAPAYPAAEFVYGWPELEVLVDGGALGDTRTFSLSMSHGVNRERYYMRRQTLKKQPIRSEIPEFTGSLTFDYADDTIYEVIRSSEVVPIVAEWKHPDPDAIAPGLTYFLRITLNAQFTGNTPQVSLDDLPTHEVEFTCLHDGSNPAVKIEYQSTDTDY